MTKKKLKKNCCFFFQFKKKFKKKEKIERFRTKARKIIRENQRLGIFGRRGNSILLRVDFIFDFVDFEDEFVQKKTFATVRHDIFVIEPK